MSGQPAATTRSLAGRVGYDGPPSITPLPHRANTKYSPGAPGRALPIPPQEVEGDDQGTECGGQRAYGTSERGGLFRVWTGWSHRYRKSAA